MSERLVYELGLCQVMGALFISVANLFKYGIMSQTIMSSPHKISGQTCVKLSRYFLPRFSCLVRTACVYTFFFNQQTISTNIKDKKAIRGIGFDATCSLVALNSNGDAVPVNKSQDPNRNIIMWLDHRAIKQVFKQGRDDFYDF